MEDYLYTFISLIFDFDLIFKEIWSKFFEKMRKIRVLNKNHLIRSEKKLFQNLMLIILLIADFFATKLVNLIKK